MQMPSLAPSTLPSCPARCQKCDRSFASVQGLGRHQKSCLGGSEAGADRVPCPYCKVSFSHFGIRTHTRSCAWRNVGKVFSMKTIRRSHINNGLAAVAMFGWRPIVVMMSKYLCNRDLGHLRLLCSRVMNLAGHWLMLCMKDHSRHVSDAKVVVLIEDDPLDENLAGCFQSISFSVSFYCLHNDEQLPEKTDGNANFA